MHYHWGITAAKKERGPFEQRTSSKKSSGIVSQKKKVWLVRTTTAYVTSTESCGPKRFCRCWNKFERKYIQKQQPNQFHCYNQNMGLVKIMDQSEANCRVGIGMKKWWWSPFA